MDLDQVLPTIYVGAHPEGAGDIERLKRDFGITAVLSLQSDEDLDYWNLDWHELETCYRASGIQIVRVPVTDFDHNDLCRSLPDCVSALENLLAEGHTVFVHCNVGAGRSPSVVIAYLHWVQQWDLDGAASHVRARRPCSPNLEAIETVTPKWLRKRPPGT
jgi:atypical dual specificity phosphatase